MTILASVSISLIWALIFLYVIRRFPRLWTFQGEYAEHHTLFGVPLSDYKYLKCGNSIEEAKEAGCYYDILANHWLPKPCSDQASVEDYQKDGSWHGYSDVNRTQPLTMAAMGESSHYYTSLRDHILHCAILWKKQYKAFTSGRKTIDSITTNLEHTHHCVKFLVEMTDRGQDFRLTPIKVDVGFAGCFVGEK